MAERARSASIARSCVPAVAAMACVGLQLVLAASPVALERPAFITALAALAMLAVGTSFFWSMGVRRESLAIRLTIAVPLALSIALIVVLMLDGHVRRLEALP